MSTLDGPGEGTWSVFAMKVVEERDEARAALHRIAVLMQCEPDDDDDLVEAVRLLVSERDEARAELAKTSADFHDVWESRDKVIEERERARQACNAYWHDLTRIALLCAQTDDEYPLKAVERTVRERDEALAQVARREREHEALLETAQKALAHVEAERDALQEELDDTRDALHGAMMLAEERGAEWAIRARAQVVYSLAGDEAYRTLAREVCAEARKPR